MKEITLKLNVDNIIREIKDISIALENGGQYFKDYCQIRMWHLEDLMRENGFEKEYNDIWEQDWEGDEDDDW